MEPSFGKPSAQQLIRLLVIVFFLACLALGLMLTDDYGVGWDEQYERLHGLVVMDYFNDLSGGRLFEQTFTQYKLDEYFNRHYGTFFQTAAMGLEFAFGLDDPREWHLLRHYMTFLTWFLALVFFYKLLVKRFLNRAFSLIGVIFMILSPRIFADAFYNSKDIVFLAFYIISTYTLVNFLEKPTLRSGFWHALSCALLINTRILGIILPVISLVFIVFKLISHHRNKPLITYNILHSTYYVLFLLFLTVALWPYLWENPFGRLADSFRTMGHFPWDDPVLYWGEFIPATHLPFHYIPGWILITTPVLYTLFFLIGTGSATFSVFKKDQAGCNQVDFIQLALFFLPLLAVIFLRSTLYDGWRQMFFLYGPFMMLAMAGFDSLLRRAKSLRPGILSRWSRMLLFLLILLSLGGTGVFMITGHPHQNVYFNFLAGKQTTRDFEADYWGLSYRQALEHLVENDPRDSIRVFAINWPGQANAGILRPDQRRRLVFTTPDKADYWLSNYRFPGEHDRYFRHDPPYDRVFWEKRVNGNPVVGVYLLK